MCRQINFWSLSIGEEEDGPQQTPNGRDINLTVPRLQNHRNNFFIHEFITCEILLWQLRKRPLKWWDYLLGIVPGIQSPHPLQRLVTDRGTDREEEQRGHGRWAALLLSVKLGTWKTPHWVWGGAFSKRAPVSQLEKSKERYHSRKEKLCKYSGIQAILSKPKGSLVVHVFTQSRNNSHMSPAEET